MNDSKFLPRVAKSILTKHGGPARLNRYRVIMPTLQSANDSLTLDVLCRSMTLPGRTLNTAVRRTNMKEIQVASGYTNTAVDLQFTETADFAISRYFDAWMAKAVNPTTYDVAYHDDVVQDVLVMSTDDGGAPKYVCRLRNAFVKTKTQVDMNDPTMDTNVELRVTLEYEDFEILSDAANPKKVDVDSIVSNLTRTRNGNYWWSN